MGLRNMILRGQGRGTRGVCHGWVMGLGSLPQCSLLPARSPRLFCYQQASRLLPADRCIQDVHPGYRKSGERYDAHGRPGCRTGARLASSSPLRWAYFDDRQNLLRNVARGSVNLPSPLTARFSQRALVAAHDNRHFKFPRCFSIGLSRRSVSSSKNSSRPFSLSCW